MFPRLCTVPGWFDNYLSKPYASVTYLRLQISVFFFLKFFNLLFIYYFYFWLCWVFISVRGLSPAAGGGGHSSSRCAGLSPSRPLLLQSTGSRCAGSAVVAHGPSCSAACGIFPDQGSNPRPLHRQADSQPLCHQGSPNQCLFERPGEGSITVILHHRSRSVEKLTLPSSPSPTPSVLLSSSGWRTVFSTRFCSSSCHFTEAWRFDPSTTFSASLKTGVVGFHAGWIQDKGASGWGPWRKDLLMRSSPGWLSGWADPATAGDHSTPEKTSCPCWHRTAGSFPELRLSFPAQHGPLCRHVSRTWNEATLGAVLPHALCWSSAWYRPLAL